MYGADWGATHTPLGSPDVDDVAMESDDELRALAGDGEEGNDGGCMNPPGIPVGPVTSSMNDCSSSEDDCSSSEDNCKPERSSAVAIGSGGSGGGGEDSGGDYVEDAAAAPEPPVRPPEGGAAEELRMLKAVGEGEGPLARALEAGSTYCLVANRWWRQWVRYTGFSDDHTGGAGSDWVADFEEDVDARPAAIDNGAIFEDAPTSTGKLRKGIREVVYGASGDYVVLLPVAYDLLQRWYGGGTRADVRAAAPETSYGKVTLDLYGLSLTVSRSAVDCDGPKTLELTMPKQATVTELKLEACRRFGIDPTGCQIWDYFNCKPYGSLEPMLKREETLKQAKLLDEQDILLNERTANGSWPELATDTYTSSYSSSTYSSSMYNTGSYGHTYSSGDTAVNSSPPAGGPGAVGLQNLGNTCFMNSVLQCLSHTPGLAQYFAAAEHGGRFAADLNEDNPLGHNGKLAEAFASLLQLVHSNTTSVVAPRNFKYVMGRARPEFSGYNQHDSQELLSFLLDGLHEDLNRVRQKPFVEAVEGAGRPDVEVAREALEKHRLRNTSWVQDLFLGQYRSTVVCPNAGCGHHTSVTFDPYTSVSLPLVSPKDEAKKTISVVICRAGSEVGAGGGGGTPPCRRLEVSVDRDATMLGLKKAAVKAANEAAAAVATAAGKAAAPPLRAEACVLCEIYSSKVFTWHQSSKEASTISSGDITALIEVGDARPFAEPKISSYSRFTSSDDDEEPADAASGSQEEDTAIGVHMVQAELSPPLSTWQRGPQAKVVRTPWLISVAARAATARTLNREVLMRLRALVRPGLAHTKLSPARDGSAGTNVSGGGGGGGGLLVSQEEFDARVDEIVAAGGAEMVDRNAAELAAVAEFVAQGVDLGAVEPLVASQEATAAAAAARGASNGGGGSGSGSGSDSDSDMNIDGLATAPGLSAEEVALLDRVLINPGTCFEIKTCSHYGPNAGIASDIVLLEWEGEAADQPLAVLAEGASYNKSRRVNTFMVWTCGSAAAALLTRLLGEQPYNLMLNDVATNNRSAMQTAPETPALDLEDCLDLFQTTETLTESDAWYCSKCKDHVLASKTLEFWSAPPVLVFHLKRFTYDEYSRDKNETPVRFARQIDMKDRLLSVRHGSAEEAGVETVYALFAVSTHFGGMGGGHYTAFARSEQDGTWSNYNDCSVSPVAEEDVETEVVTNAAYLLFYLRRDQWPAAWGGTVNCNDPAPPVTSDSGAAVSLEAPSSLGVGAESCSASFEV